MTLSLESASLMALVRIFISALPVPPRIRRFILFVTPSQFHISFTATPNSSPIDKPGLPFYSTLVVSAHDPLELCQLDAAAMASEFIIPEKPAEWDQTAGKARVHDQSLYDIQPNATKLPSASNMDRDIYLTFRSYVTRKDANNLKPEMLGILKEHLDAVKNHLEDRKDYKDYLDDVQDVRNGRRPLGTLPNLGVFGLARHFQQQITNKDIFESSVKHVISPIVTRSRAAAAARQDHSEERSGRSCFDLRGSGALRSSTPSVTTSRSSSEGHPPCGESPLASRGRATHDPEMASSQDSQGQGSPEHSRSPANTTSALSDWSAVSATAAKILYVPTADEAIVNTFLVLLLNALGFGYTSVTAEWVLERLMLKHIFGASELEARTDGCLRTKTEQITAIVEVKPHIRSKNKVAITMQETTQVLLWIATDGFPLPSERRFVLLSQDRHEVYITIPDYDADYLTYLKGEADADTPRSYLNMKIYGPWDIYDRKSLNNLCRLLLAFTLSVS
ncbi:hypothetical protein ACJ73_08484 [Blastomyces percursus]|uniref:Uncharacterized protein n=1 Tax=Blastomyces percursus TaxID=1658174 RepID=A0A1J9PUX0_9EURO|nr:hypothetical protein ACJ73_08484 [Blastomyces percursus]